MGEERKRGFYIRLLLVLIVGLINSSNLFAWVPEKTPVTNFVIWPLKYTVISNEEQTVSVERIEKGFTDNVLDIPAQVEYDKVCYTVTQISKEFFDSEGSLKELIIPATVNSIGCTGYHRVKIETINVADGNMNYTTIDGIVYDKDVATLIMCPNGRKGEINIPASVTAIGPSSFGDCKNIDSLTIPESVISIGKSAFDCSSLRYIQLPETLEYIGDYAFNGSDIESIYIPDSVNYLGVCVFGSCYSLKEARLPENENIKKLNDLFSFCESLKSVNIPYSVESITHFCFSGCESLESINIPASLTEIGNSSFEGCLSLVNFDVDENNPAYTTDGEKLLSKDEKILVSYPSAKGEVVIQEGIEVIGWSAFGYCPITRLTLPASVNRIENWAFNSCDDLNTIIMLSPTPPYLTVYTFTGEIGEDYYRGGVNIFVPDENLEAYKSKWWEELIPNLHIYGLDKLAGVNEASIGEDESYTVYSLSGILLLDKGGKEDLQALPNGIYVINGEKVVLRR